MLLQGVKKGVEGVAICVAFFFFLKHRYHRYMSIRREEKKYKQIDQVESRRDMLEVNAWKMVQKGFIERSSILFMAGK